MTVFASIPLPHDADVVLVEALALRKQGDAAKAEAILIAVRERTQNEKLGEMGEVEKLASLALLDAALGRKQEALLESQKAVDKLPISRDASYGPSLVLCQAQVFALIGERNRAIERLSEIAKIPAGPNVGDLLHPCFDELRGDPRFEKIVTDVKAATK